MAWETSGTVSLSPVFLIPPLSVKALDLPDPSGSILSCLGNLSGTHASHLPARSDASQEVGIPIPSLAPARLRWQAPGRRRNSSEASVAGWALMLWSPCLSAPLPPRSSREEEWIVASGGRAHIPGCRRLLPAPDQKGCGKREKEHTGGSGKRSMSGGYRPLLFGSGRREDVVEPSITSLLQTNSPFSTDSRIVSVSLVQA